MFNGGAFGGLPRARFAMGSPLLSVIDLHAGRFFGGAMAHKVPKKSRRGRRPKGNAVPKDFQVGVLITDAENLSCGSDVRVTVATGTASTHNMRGE